MSISPAQIGNLKYGVFYLPSLIYGYLFFQPPTPTFNILGATLPHPTVYPWALILTLFLAVFMHRMGVALFGHGGPEENPKLKIVTVFYSIPFFTPVSPDDWDLDHFDSWIEIFIEIGRDSSLFAIGRMIFLALVIGAGYVFFYYSIFPLTYYIVTGHADFVGGLLWIALVAMHLNRFVDNRFPPVGNPGSAARVIQPEYKHFEHLMDDSHSTQSLDRIQAKLDGSWSKLPD